jgi:hypothetical protein
MVKTKNLETLVLPSEALDLVFKNFGTEGKKLKLQKDVTITTGEASGGGHYYWKGFTGHTKLVQVENVLYLLWRGRTSERSNDSGYDSLFFEKQPINTNLKEAINYLTYSMRLNVEKDEANSFAVVSERNFRLWYQSYTGDSKSMLARGYPKPEQITSDKRGTYWISDIWKTDRQDSTYPIADLPSELKNSVVDLSKNSKLQTKLSNLYWVNKAGIQMSYHPNVVDYIISEIKGGKQ